MEREGFQYEVRQYEPGSEGTVLELLHSAMGEGAAGRFSPEYWRWKHHGNPFGPSKGVYAWDEGEKRAAGLRIFMRWEFVDPEGETIKAVRAVDTATHPVYRRKGIFATLTKLAVQELKEEGVHFIFNTPNDKSLPGYLKMGWSVAGRVPLYVRPLRPLRLAAVVLRSGRDVPEGGSPPDFGEFFHDNIVGFSEFAQKWGKEMDEVVAGFEAARPGAGFRTLRGPEYMRWKYGGNPNAGYGVCTLIVEGELLGFAVLRPNHRFGLREAMLEEIFVQGADGALCAKLMKNVNKSVKADYIVSHFKKGSLEHGAVLGAGFIRVPLKGITLAVRPLTASAPAPAPPPVAFGNWDLSLGDLEVM